MHRWMRLGLLATLLAGLLWGALQGAPVGPVPATAADPGVPAHSPGPAQLGYFPGQVLVQYRDASLVPSLRSAQALVDADNAGIGLHAMELHRTVPGLAIMKVTGDVMDAVRQFEQDPAVLYAEPSYVRHLQIEPNDPLYGNQRNLHLSRAPLGWDLRTAAPGVKVAVIDTGVDPNHPDLQGVIVGNGLLNTRGDQGGSSADDSGHGTAVAGVIGARGNNGQFISGAMWMGEILPIRACGTQSLICTIPDEVEAIDLAIANGAKVINLSLGGFSASNTERLAINRALAADIVILAAAGNGINGEGQLGKFGDPGLEQNIFYPAGYDGVLGVGSIDAVPNPNDLSQVRKSRFSNFGDMVDVVAVGSQIITLAPSAPVSSPIFQCIPGACYHEQKVGQISGTSFATPMVAGLAAILRAQFPDLNREEIASLIRDKARTLGEVNAQGRNDEFGFGLVDYFTALSGRGGGVNDTFVVGVAANPIFTNQIYVTVKKRQPLQGGAQPAVTVTIKETGKADRILSLSPQVLASDPNILFYRFLINGKADVLVEVKGTLPNSEERALQINYKKED